MGIPAMRPLIGILDDCDCPDAKRLVIVYGGRNKTRLQYLATAVRPMRYGLSVGGVPRLFTPIEEFGARVTFTHDGKLLVIADGVSRAKYPDGAPRRWQGRDREEIDFRITLAPHIIRSMRGGA